MLAQSGGFLGLFADPHLAATELEGGDPIPVMRQTADALDRFAAPGSELHDVLAPPGGGAEALLRRFSASLRAGADIEGLPLDGAVQAALQRVSGLAVGDYAALYAVWSNPDGGHAIMVVVIRDADEGAGGRTALEQLAARRFTWVTLNSGLGLGYHDERRGDGARAKWQHKQGLPLSGVPGWRVLDAAFFYAFFALRRSALDSTGPAAYYEVLLPWLAGGAPAAAIDAGERAARAGPWATPQRSGFCFARCVFAALRYAAARLWRWDAAAVKRLMLAHRLAWLEPAARELAAPPSDPCVSDVSAALLAARQSARALGKAVARGDVAPAGAARAEGIVQRALAALREASRGAALNVPGLAECDDTVPLVNTLPPSADALAEEGWWGAERWRRAGAR
jgi:hypothetical protein